MKILIALLLFSTKLIATDSSKYLYKKEDSKNFFLHFKTVKEEFRDLAKKSPFVLEKKIATSEEVFSYYVANKTRSLKKKVFIAAGIHGNEALTSVSALDLLKLILKNPKYLDKYSFHIIPLANPWGLIKSHRKLENGTDLNRIFDTSQLHPYSDPLEQEIKARSPYDLALDLHGTLSSKFFVISTQENDKLAKKVLEKSFDPSLLQASDSGKYPDYRGIKDDPKRYMMYAPGISMSSNVGTLKDYLKSINTKHSYTLEYPRIAEIQKTRKNFLKLIVAFLDANF